MEIKDQSGNVVGVIELKEGYNIKDIIRFVSGKSLRVSFKDLVNIGESDNKKQLIFKFSNGEIFYDLPSKTFVRSNGVKINEESFKYINLNIGNKLVAFSIFEVDNFWLMLAEKTNVTWIKTFFKLIDIEANQKGGSSWLEVKKRTRDNRLQQLIAVTGGIVTTVKASNIKNKNFLDNIENFAKLPNIQNICELDSKNQTNLIKFYRGISKSNIIFDHKISFDKWLIRNINKEISSVYSNEESEEEREILGEYALDYGACQKNGLKEVFQYCFDNYKGIIAEGYIERIKKLISLGYEQKRLIDYLYRDAYNQGLELNFSRYDYYYEKDALNLLHDYANMNTDMGCDFEKYPKYLSTMHDIVQKNYQIKEDEIIKEKFKKVVKSLKNKKLVYSDDDYVIVLPKNSKDLTKEGQNLSHCVASYYKRMALGETNIVFLRNKKIVNESLVTIELNSMYEIVQAKGKNNSSPKEPERKFVDKYEKYLASLAKV